MDPRQAALMELETLLIRTDLDDDACHRVADLLDLVPGRQRTSIQRLASTGSPAAIEALLRLDPALPGVTEGVFRGIQRGVRRRFGTRVAPELAALELHPSRARSVNHAVERAREAFGTRFEALDVDGRRYHRVVMFPDRLEAPEVHRLLPQLEVTFAPIARRKGWVLWLDGWRFGDRGPLRPASVPHLLAAWVARVRRSR